MPRSSASPSTQRMMQQVRERRVGVLLVLLVAGLRRRLQPLRGGGLGQRPVEVLLGDRRLVGVGIVRVGRVLDHRDVAVGNARMAEALGDRDDHEQDDQHGAEDQRREPLAGRGEPCARLRGRGAAFALRSHGAGNIPGAS